VAAVLLTVQVLGQVVVDWDLSIAQLLVCLGSAFCLEVGVVLWRRGVLAWPASALLTGNGVALLLRVPGTEHGDWWSLRGAHVFAATTLLAVASKYMIRVDRRPLFNPSNLALVVCFLALGATRVDPQDLWWGPWSIGLAVTYGVIVGGGVVITRRLGLLPVATAFMVALALGVGVVAASGHAITARWHVGLLTGADYWRTVVLSPETFIFLFFMITDPRTIPTGRSARIVHGALVGVLAALFVAPQTTEFATKVGIISALVVVCAGRPLLERLLPEGTAIDARRRLARSRPALASSVALVALVLALVVAGARSRDLLPDHDLVGDRPAVVVGDLPAVVIDESVEDVDLTFDRDDVDDLARDLAEDLVIEGEAVRTGDLDIVAHAAVGDRLDELRDRIREGDAEVPVYAFDELRLILHRELEVGQAAPRLGIEAHGTVRLDRAVDGRVSRGRTEDHAAVYLLTEVDGHWLIDDERPV